MAARHRLGEAFTAVVAHLLEARGEAPGKVLVCGVGKSGLVARRIAATLSSTGTPAIFLHAAEALHGEAGVALAGDAALVVSHGGSSKETLEAARLLRQRGCSLIALTGQPQSPLAQLADFVLDASVAREADPANVVPTASAAVAQALGDALAICLMQARGLDSRRFAETHPRGLLGRGLRLTVADVLHGGSQVAWANPGASLREVIMRMTRCPLGAACIVDEGYHLLGLVTDGDVRRALEKYDDIRAVTVAQVMTAHPTTIGPDATLLEALRRMERRTSQISVLPVVGSEGVCLGLVRLHDLYRPEVEDHPGPGL